MGNFILECHRLSKRLSRRLILSDISFRLRSGDRLGIVGPVGAGKTTLLYIILGLISPDRGKLTVFGKPLQKQRQEILGQVNFASSNLKLNGYSSVRENLITFAWLYGVGKAPEKIARLARDFGVAHLLKTKVYRLSAGENTKVNLCKALLNDPKLLLLDEIVAHLDPVSAAYVKRRLLQENREKNLTFVYVSHNLKDIEAVCNRVIVLGKGRLRYDGKILPKKKLLAYYA